MENNNFGIVIKVRNLTACKAFYRDILGLGDPVQDSNFRVEFRCGEAFSIFLEKNMWDEPVRMPSSGSISWFFNRGDAKIIQEKMRLYGFSGSSWVVENKAGKSLCRFTDPEGNAFYVPAPDEKKN